MIWRHYPDYYAFSGANQLNQVAASRFAVNWLVLSPRVKGVLARNASFKNNDSLDFIKSGEIPVINETESQDNGPKGQAEIRIIKSRFLHSADNPKIAIEIPVNWTAIQNINLALAREWRAVTDEIFQEYVGTDDGQYAITDVTVFKENQLPRRAFLIGQKFPLT